MKVVILAGGAKSTISDEWEGIPKPMVEIGAMPIIESVAQEYNVPVLFFSMDTHTSETGFLTRIEAFCDMLEMRKS